MSFLSALLPKKKYAKVEAHTLFDISRPLDSDALYTLQQLKAQGFSAYIVGGAVRDMILGVTPKDFDIVTNATPSQIKGSFRRAQLIGRRFKIVHVYKKSRPGFIEVSTFRKSNSLLHNSRSSKKADNHYGSSMEQDAARRDLTINTLYYDVSEQVIFDFCNAVADVKNRQIRFIGDTETSIDFDPVRMLRAIRLAAKLAFKLPVDLQQIICSKCDLLQAVPAARLLDEVKKIFLAGHAVASMQMLQVCGIDRILFCGFDKLTAANSEFIAQALINTDQRVKERKPVVVAFLLAVLLWPSYQRSAAYHKALRTGRQVQFDFFQTTCNRLLDEQSSRVHLLVHMRQKISQIWHMQWQFDSISAADIPTEAQQNFVKNTSFRAAFDFFQLRNQHDKSMYRFNKLVESVASGTVSASSVATFLLDLFLCNQIVGR